MMKSLKEQIPSARNGTGVYCITNIIDEKVYIGSTCHDINHRITMHRSRLRCGKHANPHLQASYNKFGEDAFSWDILIKAENNIHELESFWCEIFSSHENDFGYNMKKVLPFAKKSGAIYVLPKGQKNHTLVSIQGEVVVVENITKFARERSLSQPHLCRVVNGKRMETSGWRLLMPIRQRLKVGRKPNNPKT